MKLYIIKRYLAWDMLDLKTFDLENKGNWDWDSVTHKINMVSRVISIAILLTRLLYNVIFSFAMFFCIIFYLLVNFLMFTIWFVF